jgi:hypothetical protein
MIIPPPGKGSCQNCGYEPGDYKKVAEFAAMEVGKYLGKALAEETAGNSKMAVQNRSKNLTHSMGWPRVEKEENPVETCEACGEVHKTTFWGLANRLTEQYPGLTEEMKNVAYHPSGGAPCGCWPDVVWVGSKDFWCGKGGLTDLLLSLPEPGG